MKLLTKVAKGVAYGDVSNVAVRNVLTELSKRLYGGITEQEMEDTMELDFNWECPYTGRNLEASVKAKDGSYATDHIYPQNRDWCGLNVKGNLIIVDKKANAAKGKMDIKTFMESDLDFWRDLGIDKATRMARLKKIEDFQKKAGYDPEHIRKVVSPLLKAFYDDVRKEQEKTIDKSLDELEKIGVLAIKPIAVSPAVTTSGSKATTSKKRSTLPELIFTPSDEVKFKDELLKSKKAHFKLTYSTGVVKTSSWNASEFSPDSNLRNNIMSRTFWRERKLEGLLKVEAFVD